MNADLIYVFDKLTKLGENYGEIQSNFNMSLTIDGTDNSSKIEVCNFSSPELEPNTIIYHPKTNNWWIVREDKVERYQNDDGFYYVHNIKLDDSLELLNARDLTDSGFNENTYTIRQFIERLFALSTFDYDLYLSDGISSNFLNKKVDFIKTFENYSPLSALREFVNAYNMYPKLTFSATYSAGYDRYTITSAVLDLVQKTGNFNLPTHDLDFFDEVKEVKILNKDSFGASVVSNADNVISTKLKTYPSCGSVKLSCNENTVSAENALIRLPSKVFKGNWIKLLYPFGVFLKRKLQEGDTELATIIYETGNYQSYEEMVDYFCSQLESIHIEGLIDEFREALVNEKNIIKPKLESIGTITLYNGNKLVPNFSGSSAVVEIQKGDKVPYLAKIYDKDAQIDDKYIPFVFCDKEISGSLPIKEQGIIWERGSNIISGFNFLENIVSSFQNAFKIENTDYQSSNTTIYSFRYRDSSQTPSVDETLEIIVNSGTGISTINKALNCSFIVNYIPMSDIKIKVDNQRDKKDVQLYNQSGKMSDSVAFSKLLNSFSKEISSDKITRYKNFVNYNDIPKVGSCVINGNEYYVINNISYDFVQNENSSEEFGYYISCEFTMCKYISTKSLMVNPNTNIRDYGIPQSFNVKRKQLYRDYYELNYDNVETANVDSPYFNWEKIFDFGNETKEDIDLTAVMKITYKSAVSGHTSWYYQLDTITYYFNKMYMVMLDFNDNNIIGYSGQNIFSGFDITRIFTGMTDFTNTPVEYTDDDGQFKDIDILLLDNDNLTKVYRNYLANQDGVGSFNYDLYNYSVFIDSDIYTGALNYYYIRINEINYNKDALEVPVFEYLCQIDDSEEVLIGDNILEQRQNCQYFYSFRIGSSDDHYTQNNVVNQYTIQTLTSPNRLQLDNGVKFQTITTGSTKRLVINFYLSMTFNMSSNTYSYGTEIYPTANRDIAIFRHSFNKSTGEQTVDLMFVLKKVPSSAISTNTITLRANYWKLD